MKTLQVTQEIYESQLEKCMWHDDSCDCFGMNIEGRLFLYNESFGDDCKPEYHLTIFDKTLLEMLTDDKFVSKLMKEKIERGDDNICDFCGFVADCMNGNYDEDKRPFQLYDIIYSL